MFKCECGSEEFYTHMDEEITVYYDGAGDEIDGGDMSDANRTHNWPYRCISCDKEYSQLPPLDAEKEWVEERQRWYLDKKGSQCPFCESDAIEGGSLQVDGDTVWQQINCIECDAVWDDVYYLREVEIKSFPKNYMTKGLQSSEVPNPNKAFKK